MFIIGYKKKLGGIFSNTPKKTNISQSCTSYACLEADTIVRVVKCKEKAFNQVVTSFENIQVGGCDMIAEKAPIDNTKCSLWEHA